MKLLSLPAVLVVGAGAALGWIALRAPAPTSASIVEARGEIASSLSGAVPAGCVARAFHVEGMCCQGCTGTIHGALARLDGVAEVAVSLPEERALLYVRADVPLEALTAAVEAEGYALLPVE